MPIVVANLTHIYSHGSAMAVQAVKGVTLSIADGERVGIIGRTGSGKTTLIQLMAGLIKPTSGRVIVDGVDISDKRSAQKVRLRIGLVFQYPEHQLFEETVAQDVAFGPKNLGIVEPELSKRVDHALELVGLPASIKERSPFELSGGQMRRVAIAGVLAMKPRVLILDEPTAGLDPKGRADLLAHLEHLHQTLGITVILVTHSMDDVARIAERLIVLDDGAVVLDGPTREVFSQVETLESLSLSVPPATKLMWRLHQCGKPVRYDVVTVEEAACEILRAQKERS